MVSSVKNDSPAIQRTDAPAAAEPVAPAHAPEQKPSAPDVDPAAPAVNMVDPELQRNSRVVANAADEAARARVLQNVPGSNRAAAPVAPTQALAATGPDTAPSFQRAAAGSYIREGQQGASVVELKNLLRGQGVQVDSSPRFTAETTAAVREFQRTHNCKVDGVVGPETLGALGQHFGGAGPARTTTAPRSPAPNGAAPAPNGAAPAPNGAAPAPNGAAPAPNGAAPAPNGAAPALNGAAPAPNGAAPAPNGAAPAPNGAASAPAPNGAEPAAPAAPTGTAPQTAASSTTLNLPPRPAGALTGSQFIAATQHMNRAQREEFIQQQVLAGNVPESSRQMRDVQVTSRDAGGQTHNGTLHVMPDYISVGSNEDSIRVPMSPITAQHIADATGTNLPTRKIVNDVYAQADIRLRPQPLPAGPQMMSSDYYARHDAMVDQQRGTANPGVLVAGQKKDVVVTNRLDEPGRGGRVAIYGWHQENGRPIQGLSTVHENTYADYSHGTRLIGATMTVDGRDVPVSQVMRDPNLAGLVSDEGVIRDHRAVR